MSTRYEGAAANSVGVEFASPLETIGGERLGPGQFAILVNYDEVFYVTGTPDELVQFGEAIVHHAMDAKEKASRPLSLDDVLPDIDGDWACPRCERFWGRDAHASFASIMRSIQQHIDEHNAERNLP